MPKKVFHKKPDMYILIFPSKKPKCLKPKSPIIREREAVESARIIKSFSLNLKDRERERTKVCQNCTEFAKKNSFTRVKRPYTEEKKST